MEEEKAEMQKEKPIEHSEKPAYRGPLQGNKGQKVLVFRSLRLERLGSYVKSLCVGFCKALIFFCAL